MSSDARTLKYGDVIRIHGMSKGSPSKGILVSKGFTDPNIYYQKYEDFNEVNSFRQSLFQIIPKTSFHINDELLKDNLLYQVVLFRPKQREAIKIRAVSEEAALVSNLNVRQGTQIFYGAQVLFKHVDSGGYLLGVLEAAESGEGSFKLNLTDQLSSYLGFKIRSHRSYEREGDKVYLDDPLQIYHSSSDCFVNFNDGSDYVFLDKEFERPEFKENDPALTYISVHPIIRIGYPPRINVVNQNKSKCLWKFILYEDFPSTADTATIKPHDIVYFEHTQNNGLLTSSVITQDATIKENNKRKQDITFYDSLWEMIPREANQIGPEKPGKYFIRNIITGKYLCLDDGVIKANGAIDSEKAVVELMNQTSQDPMSDRNLINIMVKKEKIDRGHKIVLEELPPIQKSYIESIDKFEPILISKEVSEHSFAITKPPKKDLGDILFVLSASECISKFCELVKVPSDKPLDSTYYDRLLTECTDGVLDLVSYTFKALIGKIFECHYTQIDNAGKTPSLKVQKMMVETGLTELTIETIYFMGLHERFIFGQHTQHRSLRNKLSSIFEDAYKLLEKIVINCEENRIYISRWVELIMDHSYKINKSCIQQCLVGILQNNSISIEATIDEKKIQDLVHMFKEEAKKNGPQTKYLRLLSAFIKCADKIFRANQQRVLRLFFNDETNQYRFKFKCGYKATNDDNAEYSDQLTKLGNSREVHILYGKRDPLTFNQFFKNEKETWNYFLEYVNLMADVCIDRNTNSIETISQILPLQYVLVILSDPNLALVHQEISKENAQRLAQNLPPKFQNIYEPFIRIAHHVYVNIKKFSPIRRISKIKYWYSMNPDDDIPKTKRVFQGQKEQEEKKYLGMILEFIRMFLNKCELNPNNITEMKALYTTLDLLRITVTLGLWNTVKQFRELLPALFMKIIKFDNNYIFKNGSEAYLEKQELDKQSLKAIVAQNKKNIKMTKPEMLLAIDCKNKAAEIFSLMIDMETNIRVTNLTLFFKGLYEASEAFQVYNVDHHEEYPMSDAAANRNRIAKNSFNQDDDQGLLLKPKKKKVQLKEIILEEKIWLNKLKELTPIEPDRQQGQCRRYFFDKIESFDEMIMALLEVSEHQDFKMLNSSMLLLRKIFGQRQDLIKNFNNVVLCAKGNFYDITIKIREMKYKFNMLRDPEILNYSEESAKQFPYPIWKPYDQTTKEELRRSGIIQDLFFLSRVLKQNANLKNIQALMTVDESVFDRDRLIPFYNEREQNDRLFQTMALVQEVHVPIFAYIEQIKEEPPSQDHHRLLFSIYNYLTLLVFNNLENKQHLMQYIRLVLPHLKYRVGAPQFIYNICFNNKILVSDEDLVKDIAEAIINACQNFGIDDYERSSLLFSLRSLVLFNEKGHKRNQKLVVNLLQKNRDLHLIENRPLSVIGVSKKTSVMDFNMLPAATYMTTMFELFAVLVESKNMINIGKLSNIYTYNYLLNALRETNYWQLRRAIRAYINRLYYLNQDDDIFLFEEFIRNEFYIISQQLTQLVEIYTKQHEDREINNAIRFSYAGSHTYLALLQILTTLYNVFDKPVFFYLLNKEFKKREKKRDFEMHNNTVKIAKNLGFIVNNRYTQDMRSKMTGSYIRQILEQLKKFMMDFDLGFLEEVCQNQMLQEEAPEEMAQVDSNKKYVYDYSKPFFRNLYEMIVMVNQKKKKERLIKEFNDKKNNTDSSIEGRKTRFIDMIFSGKLVEGLRLTKMISAQRAIEKREGKDRQPHINPSVMTSISKHFKVLAKPTLSENEQNLVLNKKLYEVKTLLEYCPLYQKFINDEFIKLVKTLTNIDEISKKHYTDYSSQHLQINNFDMPVVSLDEVFKNMFKMSMDHPTQIDDKYKIPIIKLIRCYISEAIEKDQEYKLGVDSWEADYVADDEQAMAEFVNRQNRIDKCGGADFIVEILKQNLDNRIEVMNEVLLLGIVFLFGGNRNCQDSMLAALKKDPSNSMLVNLNHLIKKIGDFVYSMNKKKENKDKRQKNFNFSHEDTYDYYNVREKVLEKKFGYEIEDRMEAKVKTDNENALVRSFRFMQLFCENNNVQMKKFLLEQTNEDNKKKVKTINFIETTTLLLRKFFKIMNRDMRNFKMTLLLDFINECTQIPCLDNQIALTKSSYFEDVCYMSSFFNSQDNLKQRLFDTDNKDTLSQLYEIYQKSIQLALSNLEGNEDRIYTEFISKCEARFLWEITQRNLQIKIDQYKENKKLPDLTLADFNEVHINAMLADLQAKEKVFDEEMINILNIFTILLKVRDHGEFHSNKAQSDKQNVDREAANSAQNAQNAMNFREKFVNVGQAAYPHMEAFMAIFQKLLLQIEINCSSGKQYVYFPFNPVFKFLAKDTKKRIMFEVNRDTQRDKLIGILGYREQVFGEIKWNYEMKFQNKYTIFGKELNFEVTSSLYTNLRKIAICVSIFIMALMMTNVELEHDTYQHTSEYSYGRYPMNWILKFLSLLQLGLSLSLLGVWIILRYPLALAKEEKQKRDAEALESKSKQKPPELPESEQAGPSRFSAIKNVAQRAYTWLSNSRLGKVGHLLKCFWKHESEFGPILLFVAVSLAGNFIGMQYFTIHIFDIFLQISLLGNVFKAITFNTKVLSILSLLAGAFIFVFNVLSFGTYASTIYPEDQPEEVCENLFNCVLTMYNSGAIGDEMDEFNPSRFAFDLIYIVFMELLFQNLVGGVIIDSFTEMREKDQGIVKDQQSMCFICGKDRAQIENENEIFLEHIKPHDLWNYLYYIYSLEEKDETDYSGMQYEIKDKIDTDDVNWFPISEASNDDELEGKMTQLKSAIEQIRHGTMECQNKTIRQLESWSESKKDAQ